MSPLVPLAGRERRLFLLCFGLLLSASLIPLFLNPYPPLVDIAHQSGAAAVWHYYDDPAWNFSRYYELKIGPAPYYAYYVLMRLLALPAGMLWATRAVVALGIVAPPLVALVLTKRFERSPWLSLFVFPMVWSLSFQWGFLNYCLGMMLAMIGLVVFDRFCERYDWRDAIAGVVIGVVIYFFHLLPWGFWMGACTIVGLMHRGRSVRALFARGLVVLPSLMVGGAVVLRGRHLNMGTTGKLHFKFYSPWSQLLELFEWVWRACVDHFDVRFGTALFALVIVVRLTAGRPRFDVHAMRFTAVAWFALALFCCLPRSVIAPIYWWGLNIRFAFVAVYLLSLSTPGAITGWRRWLMAPVFVIGLLFCGDAMRHWHTSAEHARGYRELSSIPTRDDRVLVLIFRPENSPDYTFEFMRAYPLFYQIEHGGYSSYNFDEGFPLAFRVRYPAPDWSAPHKWNAEKHAPYYDYFLFFNGNGREFAASVGRGPAGATKVKQIGRWSLWKKNGPRVDESPVPPYPRSRAWE